MKLIQLSDSVFVNPACISCIEQRRQGKVLNTIVWVDGKSYGLAYPLSQLLKQMDNLDIKMSQEFAG